MRFNNWFDRQAERYKEVIAWALDHRWAMVALALAAFIGALAMPALGIIGGSFLPVTDDSEFNVTLAMPPGSNLAYTRVKAEEVARLARAKPEVAYTYTTVGGRGEAVDEGTVFVKMTPKHERDRSQAEVSAELRRELERLGGVTASISTGFGDGQKQIQLQLQGPTRRSCSSSPSASPRPSAKFREPLTSACLRKARSRSSTCRSIAALRDRSG